MSKSNTLPPWVLVCGGFHRFGGMDHANLALAEALLEQGREVFLVGHRFDPELLRHPGVNAKQVGRSMGILMAEGALRREGMRVASQVTRRFAGTRVVVNGGNCPWPDINWVHSVHAAWQRFDTQAPLWFRTKSRINKQKARADEMYALRRAKLVVANSERTRRDLIELGIAADKIHVVYLGSAPAWKPPTDDVRNRARNFFGLPIDTTVVSFVGALGYDRNKGFDTLLKAWKDANLSNAILVAAGGGRGFAVWHREIGTLGLRGSVRLLGFTDHVGELLAASDLFVSPVRYEAFGLNALEAICRGVPSIVSKAAGIAELYPPELSRYLAANPEDAHALASAISQAVLNSETPRDFDELSAKLRAYTMRDMARKIIAIAEQD